MTKLTDKELWDALDDLTAESAAEDEFKRRLAMTPEEHRESLAKEGYEVKALDAEADVFFASLDKRLAEMAPAPALEPAPAPAPPTHALEPVQAQPAEAPRERSRVRPLWRRPLVAIPSALALAAGVILVVRAYTTRPVIENWADVPSPNEERALTLRKEALDACRADEWQKCLDELDQAQAVDPAGDATRQMKELRAIAEQGLRDTPPVPSTPPHRPGPDDDLKVPRKSN